MKYYKVFLVVMNNEKSRVNKEIVYCFIGCYVFVYLWFFLMFVSGFDRVMFGFCDYLVERVIYCILW